MDESFFKSLPPLKQHPSANRSQVRSGEVAMMYKNPRPKRPRVRQQHTKVLIVLESDGFFKVYGESGVSVHIAQRLHAEDNQAEILAEDYLDLTLPKPYKELFFPNKEVACGQCRQITAEDEIARRTELAVIREVRSMTAPLASKPEAIANVGGAA